MMERYTSHMLVQPNWMPAFDFVGPNRERGRVGGGPSAFEFDVKDLEAKFHGCVCPECWEWVNGVPRCPLMIRGGKQFCLWNQWTMVAYEARSKWGHMEVNKIRRRLVPAVFESQTGVRVSDLTQHIATFI